MINNEIKYPLYLKGTILLVGFVALMVVLYMGKSIIVPLIFSIILAVLLQSVVSKMVQWGVNRIIAIIISLTLTLIITTALGALLISQIIEFKESWPLFVEHTSLIINQFILEASEYYQIDPLDIHAWITKTSNELINKGSDAIGETILALGNVLVIMFLIPVYVYIILYYKPLLTEFVHRAFATMEQSNLNKIMGEIKTVIHKYLVGLIFEVVIVAVLNSAGLLLIGIEYAVLIGSIGALLNVIPYVGGVVAIALPIMVALTTETSGWPIFYIILLYTIVQTIDNNYIVPMVVSSKVKINALFSIIVVIAGNYIWGISGMFLAIPLLAIVKVIFDHIDSMKHWGFLLGDTMPPIINLKKILKKPI